MVVVVDVGEDAQVVAGVVELVVEVKSKSNNSSKSNNNSNSNSQTRQ